MPNVRADRAAIPIFGLFERRFAGDDALLALASLRFRQAGLLAEAYVDSPAAMHDVLRFCPAGDVMMHLPRGIDLLRPDRERTLQDFIEQAPEQVVGLVVHDQPGAERPEYQGALGRLDRALAHKHERLRLFVEYACGLDPARYTDVMQEARSLERVSACIDIGHIAIRQLRAHHARLLPGSDPTSVDLRQANRPEFIAALETSIERAVGDVHTMIARVGTLGKRVHFHLHDGHPFHRTSPYGVHDHMGFFDRIVVPTEPEGRGAVDTLYGPGGLSRVLSLSVLAIGERNLSYTLELHETDGEVPLADAAPLFERWSDTTNARKTAHWLSELQQHHRFVRDVLASPV